MRQKTESGSGSDSESQYADRHRRGGFGNDIFKKMRRFHSIKRVSLDKFNMSKFSKDSPCKKGGKQKQPDQLLEEEMRKLKTIFSDVKNEQEDLQKLYSPALPECLQTNKFKLKEDDFAEFKQKYLEKKKKLEMDLIKQNKRN